MRLRHLFTICIALLTLLLVGCNDDDPLPTEPCRRTVLLYAVATNSLTGSEERDMAEMLQGIESVNTEQCRWLVYLRSYNSAPALYEVVNRNGVGEKRLLKTYTSTPLSTTTERMEQVIADMQQIAPAQEYGLILWSHALAWEPADDTANLSSTAPSEAPSRYSFGEDCGDTPTAKSGLKMDIRDLQSAIPSDLFNFIWMDCCYMGSVEVAYQLRQKCRYYIAYPTEVLSSGSPYQLTLPLLMGDTADILGAAQLMFDYYNTLSGIQRSATIAIYDMTQIEPLATAVSRIMQRFVDIDTSGLQCYTRGNDGPYYDLGDYMQRQATLNGSPEELIAALNTALDDMVVYKDATPGFLGAFAIKKDRYSGISVHPYSNDGTYRNRYYTTLDWYKRVF
jgi:hypothetical protein